MQFYGTAVVNSDLLWALNRLSSSTKQEVIFSDFTLLLLSRHFYNWISFQTTKKFGKIVKKKWNTYSHSHTHTHSHASSTEGFIVNLKTFLMGIHFGKNFCSRCFLNIIQSSPRSLCTKLLYPLFWTYFDEHSLFFAQKGPFCF